MSDGVYTTSITGLTKYAHIIHAPDSLGLNCNPEYGYFNFNGTLSLGGGSVVEFFPYYPWFMLQQNTFEQTADSGYMQVCLPDSARFGVTQNWRMDSVVWDFGVPGMAPVVGSSDSIAFLYPAPGIYPVQALVFRGCPTRADTIRDTVQVFVTPDPALPEDSAICQGSMLALDVTTPTASYLWQDGSANAIFQTGTAGLIWVEVSNLCGTVRDSLDLAVHQPGNVTLGADTSYLCAGDSVVYQLVLDQGSFLWEDGSDDPNRTIYTPGIYSVEAWNACDTLRDTVEILPLGLPTADLGADTALCQGEVMLLSAAASQGTVIWSTGSTDPQISIGSTGIYFVEASNACTTVWDTVEVEMHDPPVADLGPDQVRCEGDVLDLDLSFPFGSYLWENGSTDAIRSLSQSGLYHIAVTTACGTERDSLDLVFETPPVVDLGADSSLCPGETMSLQVSGLAGVSYLWSTGDTSGTIVIGSPGDYELTVQAQACVSRDTISIAGLELPSVDLGADTLLCDGHSLILDATFAGATYRWSTGANTPQLTVDAPGSYDVTVENRCGSASDSIAIQTGINPDIDLGEDRTACVGDTVWLDASTDFATYLWQDGSEEAQVGAIQTDLYQVSVSTICGTATQDVFLEFIDLPDLNLGPDTLICEGEFYILEASTVATPGRALTTIQWPDGSSSPEYVFSEPGAYQVLALNDCGETADTLLLQFRDCDCHVYVASAFSPNGDGHNEVFKPGLSCDFTDYQFSIYHRWGKQVFTTSDPSQGWNGLNAPEGVYAWTVSYRWIGRGGVEVGEVRSGTVVLGR